MHYVDLGESFPTHIYLQNLASIQPRTSPVKFAHSPCTDPPGIYFCAVDLGVDEESIKMCGLVFLSFRVLMWYAAIINPPLIRTVLYMGAWMASMYLGVLVCFMYHEIVTQTPKQLILPMVGAIMALNCTCMFCLLLWMPYKMGQIMAQGFAKQTLYNDKGKPDPEWTLRGYGSHDGCNFRKSPGTPKSEKQQNLTDLGIA